MLAPICLFTYNRPFETRRTVEALKNNYLAKDSQLIIFSDGAKNDIVDSNVLLVREFIKSISGFKSITIFESDTNKGLADSIIAGVTQVLKQYNSVIVLEDDLVTTPNFLDFMNQALTWYSSTAEIMSVNGYSLSLNDKSKDIYFQHRPFSWGWGTWANRWDIETFDKQRIKSIIESENDILNRFNNKFGNDISKMLLDSIYNRNHSWYVRWTFKHFLNNKYTVFPTYSLVENIGFSELGTHCKGINSYFSELDTIYKRDFTFLPFSIPTDSSNKEYLYFFSKLHKLRVRLKLTTSSEGRKQLIDELLERSGFKRIYRKEGVLNVDSNDKKRKRVVILYRNLPEYRKHFYNGLKEKLESNNIQLDFYYGKTKNEDSLRGDEIEIEWAIYKENTTFKIGGFEFYWQPVLREIKGADLVIVEQANKLLINYLLMFKRPFTKTKMAYWGHGLNLQISRKDFWNIFKRMYSKNCDWWFAYTQGVAKMLSDWGFSKEKTTIVQNAIDTKKLIMFKESTSSAELEQLKNELGIGEGPVAIFSGALVAIKAIDFLLKSCELIKEQIPTFEIIILGNGAYRIMVEEWVREKTWAHYVGPKFEKQKVPYFMLSDIMMIPGLIGLAIIDSFVFETPLCTTMKNYPVRSPEIEYLKKDINGICSKDCVTDYANSIVELLNSKEKLEMLKKQCKIDATNYTMEQMVDNFANGVIACLNNKK